MFSKLRLVVLSLFILSLLALIAGAVLVWPKVKPITATLSDGSTIWVRAVLGSTNNFTTDTPLYKVARKYLPAKLSGWIPRSTISGHCGPDSGITVYMTRKNASGGFMGSFWGRVDAVDDEGFVYQNHPGSCGLGNEIIAFSLQSLPRRQETFKVRMYDYQNVLQAELIVPNPGRRPYVEWKPEPLPQTKTNNEVGMTLNGLTVVSNSHGNIHCSWKTKLDSSDPLWKKYGEKRYSWFTDCTGNNGPLLSPRENAWKAHVQCFRNASTPFPSNEVWKIESLFVPTNGAFTLLNLSNTIERIKLWVPVISGAATLTVTNNTNWSAKPFAGQEYSWSSGSDGTVNWTEQGGNCPFVFIDVIGELDGSEVLFRFRDDNGKLIKAEEGPYGYNSGNYQGKDTRRYMKRLKIPAGQKISLEVIVNRGRQFEFLVDPKQVNGIEAFMKSRPAGSS